MGWAAGFQAGSRAVGDAIDTYYAIKERKDLEKAMGLKPEEVQARQATPEELSRAQAETRALAAQQAEEFGLTPQEQQLYAPTMPQEGQRVGLTTYKLGNQTFNRQPTQAEIDAARYTAAADVVALRNPLEAQRMRLAATQEQRAAQGFESEQQLRGLQIKEAQRKEDKTAAYETGLKELSAQTFEKPEQRTAAILDLIEKTQGPAARIQLESQYTQNDLNKITLKAKEFEDGFKQSFSKGVDATMKWLDEQNPGFTLQRVGNQIIQTNLDGSRRVFAQGNENQIMEQFAGQASPANFLAMSKNIADRQNDERRTAATEKYYASRGQLDRMGSAQYFTGDDGNTYASIPTMTKEGLKFETVRVNPEGIAMKKPGGANDGKPVKIEEEGTKMLVGGKPAVADGNGNWIPADGNGRPLGVLPSDRTKFLKEAGVPDNLVGQLPWNKTGTGILFNGKEYDPKDPKDLKTMVDTYKRLGKAEIAMQEGQAADIALQQQFRGLGGQQPSVMTENPLLWQLYRRQEQNRGLIPNLDLNRYDVP
jgi:hypothetical protein